MYSAENAEILQKDSSDFFPPFFGLLFFSLLGSA